MPRYYFHYRDEEDDLLEDRVGSVHGNLESAEKEAESIAREILEDALEAGEAPDAPRCIEVVDENGVEVLYLPFWASYVTSLGQTLPPQPPTQQVWH